MPPNNSAWFKKPGSLKDGGLIYTETDTSQIIVEPYNAISSLAFLIPAFYWLYRLREALQKFIYSLLYTVAVSRWNGKHITPRLSGYSLLLVFRLHPDNHSYFDGKHFSLEQTLWDVVVYDSLI